MNAAPADLPAPVAPDTGWTRRKIIYLVALAVVAHVALIFVFGTRKQVVPRAVGPVPHWQFADRADELIALTDPTLFILPHANDFITPFWQRTPATPRPSFDWPAAAQFLPLAEAPAMNLLGAAFRDFMQTNRFAKTSPDFLPEPKVTDLVLAPADARLPATLRVAGELAGRLLPNQTELPPIAINDLLAPSRVQVLVNPAGNVTSAVLLDSSTSNAADQRALALALRLRFAPAAAVAFGEISFHWRTVPVTDTNELNR
jgi:TonB family protein